MSADYDRLFHSSGEAVKTADDADRDVSATGPAPASGPGRSEVKPPAMPVDPNQTQAAVAPPPRQTEVTTQMPATRTPAPQRQQPNGMMRTPKSTAPTGARFEQQRPAPAPA